MSLGQERYQLKIKYFNQGNQAPNLIYGSTVGKLASQIGSQRAVARYQEVLKQFFYKNFHNGYYDLTCRVCNKSSFCVETG